ncbi:MAG: hypothetical protein EZS28_012061 [Streblomastix strix]|uniref:Uncharacterized protein n=1 Tax=Streblomastix strix TaxID=222440 RepID=A0A5J4WCN5_9EUKA|nr:MAG: hypothetical protein EZS28_012061 [Streblomastix strix]
MPPYFILKAPVDWRAHKLAGNKDLFNCHLAESDGTTMNTELMANFLDQVFIPNVNLTRARLGKPANELKFCWAIDSNHDCLNELKFCWVIKLDKLQVLVLKTFSIIIIANQYFNSPINVPKLHDDIRDRLTKMMQQRKMYDVWNVVIYSLTPQRVETVQLKLYEYISTEFQTDGWDQGEVVVYYYTSYNYEQYIFGD